MYIHIGMSHYLLYKNTNKGISEPYGKQPLLMDKYSVLSSTKIINLKSNIGFNNR